MYRHRSPPCILLPVTCLRARQHTVKWKLPSRARLYTKAPSGRDVTFHPAVSKLMPDEPRWWCFCPIICTHQVWCRYCKYRLCDVCFCFLVSGPGWMSARDFAEGVFQTRNEPRAQTVEWKVFYSSRRFWASELTIAVPNHKLQDHQSSSDLKCPNSVPVLNLGDGRSVYYLQQSSFSVERRLKGYFWVFIEGRDYGQPV